MKTRTLCIASLLVVAAAGAGRAQLPSVAAASGIVVEHYELLNAGPLGMRSLTLVSLPLAARTEAMRGLWVDVSGAYAHGTLQLAEGGSASVSGLTDTHLRVSKSLLDDRLVVSLGYLAPTGHSVYTDEEAAVAGVVAADLLPTRISTWGSGGGFTLSTVATTTVGLFRVGGGGGYSIASSFEPLRDQEFVYRPGNELQLHAFAERELGRYGKAMLRLGTRRYGNDEIGGENLYQAGARYEALGSVVLAAGGGAQAVTYAGVLHRGAGTASEEFGDAASQSVFVIGAGLRVGLYRVTLAPSVDVRLVRRSDGLNQGRLVGIGADVEVPLGAFTLVPSLRTRVGTVLPWDDATVSVRGTELAVGLRFDGRTQ